MRTTRIQPFWQVASQLLLGVDIQYEISGLLGLLAYLMSNYSIIPQNEREPNILLKYMGLASQIKLLFLLLLYLYQILVPHPHFHLSTQ